MISKAKIYEAISYCLEHYIPFVAFTLPESHKLEFFAGRENDSQDDSRVVSLTPWNGTSADSIVIPDKYSIKDILSGKHDGVLCEPEMVICNESTNPYVYKGQIISIVDILRTEIPNGKIVLSRVVTGKPGLADEQNIFKYWTNVFKHIVDANKNAFNFITWTPSTGGWISSTPELLLDYNIPTGAGRTMALAGSQDLTDDEINWDQKNIEEHDIVTDFIVEKLRENDAEIEMIERRNLSHGAVVHLCDDIKFKSSGIKPTEIVDFLSPTPALAGYPRDKAVEVLDHLELHDRNLYGGNVTYRDGKRFLAHVILRCVQFDDEKYCMYAGGGITAKSDPVLELKETDQKMKAIDCAIF